jgi:transcriptional regulator with XRE-family HTH domain
MTTNIKIGKIIKHQRKSLPLSLNQLSKLSGVSVSHLGRIEQGQRQPSTRTLQKIAKHLGFDLYELLVIAEHLHSDKATFLEEERDQLRSELNTLLERIASDSKRISEIINRIILSK